MQANVVQQASEAAIRVTSSLPELILIKGAPGVGKSSTARQLSLQLTSGVLVEVDDLRSMVVAVNWTNQNEHRKLLVLSAQLAAGFLRSGFTPVILVDTFSGNKIDGFMDVFRSEYPKHRVFVAVLHASDEVLRHRVMNREVEGFRDLTISMQINQEAASGLRPCETLIDTSALPPIEVAKAIVALAASRNSRPRNGF